MPSTLEVCADRVESWNTGPHALMLQKLAGIKAVAYVIVRPYGCRTGTVWSRGEEMLSQTTLRVIDGDPLGPLMVAEFYAAERRRIERMRELYSSMAPTLCLEEDSQEDLELFLEETQRADPTENVSPINVRPTTPNA